MEISQTSAKPTFFSRRFFNLVVIISQLIVQGCEGVKPEDTAGNNIEQVPSKEIISAYDNYKNALMNADGQRAAGFVTNNTIQYYNAILDLVLNADSNKLVLAGVLDMFTVLAIRHTVDWKRLRAMSGKDLFAYAIENGTIGKDIGKTAIGKIELKNGPCAQAELLMSNKPTNKFIYFYKEDGVWRIDLMEMIKENERGLKK